MPRARPTLELTLAVTSIALIFGLAFLIPQPLWSGQPPRPATASASDVEPFTGVGWPGVLIALAYALAWTVPFRPYARAVQLAGTVRPRVLLALSGLLILVALLIFPAFGSDVFVYVDYARLWAIYGEHPLLATPITHPEDWAFQFVWIPTQPSPYGPLWAALTWPIARLAGTSVLANAIGYKLLALAGYLACCGLIWTWPGARAWRARALLLFAWSPLVLFDTLAKAHNDVLLAVGCLLAFRRPAAGSLVTLTAGGLIKASGLALVPSRAISLARQRAWVALGGGVLVSVALTVAAYAPFWQGPPTLLPILAQTSRVVWSPGSLLIAAGVDAGAARLLLGVVWVATAGFVLMRVENAAISACLVLLATLLFLTTAFFAHYLVPAIALSAVSGNARLQQLVLALSIGSMATYAVELLDLAFGPAFLGSASYQILGSVVLLAPACITLAQPIRYRGRPRSPRA